MNWFEKQIDDQTEYLKERYENNPDSIWGLYFASLLYEQNQIKEALKICEDFLMIHSGNLVATIIIAKIYISQMNINKAKNLLLQTYSDHSSNVVLLSLLGEIAEQEKDFSTAIKFYQKILHIDPINWEIESRLNEVIKKNSADQENQKSVPFPKVLGLDQTELQAIRNVFDEMEEDQSIIKDGKFTMKLAQLYEKAGQQREAKMVYEGLLEAFPDNEGIIQNINRLNLFNEK